MKIIGGSIALTPQEAKALAFQVFNTANEFPADIVQILNDLRELLNKIEPKKKVAAPVKALGRHLRTCMNLQALLQPLYLQSGNRWGPEQTKLVEEIIEECLNKE